jgi:WD40 repeat protein
MARVFISHSSRDGASARWLADWLITQGFEAPFLDFDKHSGIPPGADWERTLYREIASCQALLIVQSPDWNASRWCFAEFTQARSLGKPILQLVGAPQLTSGAAAEPQPPICGDLQQLDLSADLNPALATLAEALTRLALHDRGGFPWDPVRPPYPGLLSFDQEDAAIYFGRDQEISDLIERLQALRVQGGGRLLLLLGASGSGKSSLLRAGLLPRLARSGRQWLPLRPFRPQRAPCAALAQTLASALGEAGDPEQLERELRAADGDGRLNAALSNLTAALRRHARAPEATVLISVDQAEELFTLVEPEEAELFFRLISASVQASESMQVLLTLRSDFLGRIQAAGGLSSPLLEVSLPPLPAERIADIIRGPARVAGLKVEDAFVQAAIHDATVADAMPLLAFALRQIQEHGGDDRVLTLADYRSLGDPVAQLSPLENAVRRAADGVIALSQPSPGEREALRDAFVPALVRINDQNDYSRRPARWSSLPPLALPLLERLVSARLLTVSDRDGERWLEVAHEALLRKWPLLRHWLDEAREMLLGCQQLEADLEQWQQAPADQKTAHLLSGHKLLRAHSWLSTRRAQFSPELTTFIEASQAHYLRQKQLRRRSQHLVITGLSLLALVASGAWLRGELEARRAFEAQTRQYLSAHYNLLESDPIQSLMYGLAAMARLRSQLDAAVPLAISLNGAVQRNGLQTAWASGHDEVWSLAKTPDGSLISGGRDGLLQIWSTGGVRQGQPLLSGHAMGVRGLVALSDREWWTAGDEGLLQRWLDGKPQGEAVKTGHGQLHTLAQSVDGQLISGGSDGMLRRWDRRSGRSLGPPQPSGHNEVWSLAVLPNGDWISGGREGSLRWWHQGKPSGRTLASGQGAVSAVLAMPDGGFFTGGDDGRLRHWDREGNPLATVHSGHSSIMALLQHRGTVLSGGSERLSRGTVNMVRGWNPRAMGSRLAAHSGQIESLSLVELCQGDLISGASDGALHHWRQGRRLGQPLATPHRRVYALGLLPSGDLVSGGDDGTLQVWRQGRAVASLATGQGGITSLVTLANGSLWSGGRDGSIRYLNPSAPGQRRSPMIQSRHGAVWVLALLPNGELLSGGDDGFLRRWRHGAPVGSPLKTPHTSVVSLVVLKNGIWITGGSGGDVQLWREGRPLGDYFMVTSGSVWSLIQRGNGDIVSANGDGTITEYPTPATAIARACQQLGETMPALPANDAALKEATTLCAKQKS